LLPGIGLYVGAALLYAGAVLLWHRDVLLPGELSWPDPGKVLMLFCWAFLQEICLLAFLFNRLCEMTHSRRAAVLAAAGLFALFHLPNPFLTLYTLGGGIILAHLYARIPNLLAATLAHALASSLVAALLPDPVTGWMKVGPLYLWALAR
jgi:membrane protease YdiL (CAAX protease family)